MVRNDGKNFGIRSGSKKWHKTELTVTKGIILRRQMAKKSITKKVAYKETNVLMLKVLLFITVLSIYCLPS